MPRDEWARANRKTAAERRSRWAPSSKPKGKKNKRLRKQERIRREMAQSKRIHDRALGPAAGPKRNAYRLAVGLAVEVRKPGGEWRPHTMQRELVLNHRRAVDSFYVFKFEGWEIRTPRPTGF